METQLEIITPEVQENTQRALTIIDQANTLMISTVDDYKIGQTLMKTVKERIKELTDIRMSQTRPLDESKSKIMLFFAIPLEKLDKAKDYLNKIMVTFTEEQDRKRREEERRLQEEARKRAEEQILEQALEAEEAGETEEAEKIIAEPLFVPLIKVVSEIPKSKDSHIREIWNAEIFDIVALVKSIAEGKTDIQAIEPNHLIKNHPFLNTMATRYQSMMNIPGVRTVSKKTQI
jgi:vacuolar-type H+-ATPase subunit I/STV1